MPTTTTASSQSNVNSIANRLFEIVSAELKKDCVRDRIESLLQPIKVEIFKTVRPIVTIAVLVIALNLALLVYLLIKTTLIHKILEPLLSSR